MPQNRNNNEPPDAMTWMKALPILAIAGIFDALRGFFEMFWFFGPALGAVICTAAGNNILGTTMATVGGKAVASGCAAAAGAAGYFGSAAFVALGSVMAIAVGLAGWLAVGLILILFNGRIFKANEYHTLWFVFSLLLSEVPVIGSFPALIVIVWRMYRTQIKKDEEVMKKYQKETEMALFQERNQKIAEFMQARNAELASAEI